MYQLTQREQELCKEIVDCAYRIHKELGPGLLEKIYEACFCYELGKKQIPFERQVYLSVRYDGLEFDKGLRMDVFVKRACHLRIESGGHRQSYMGGPIVKSFKNDPKCMSALF